jgi:hypothetical protein
VATNQYVVDQPPTVPPPPPWLRGTSVREMTVSGRLDHYILNDRGDIDGLILNDGYEVKVGPPVGPAVAMALTQQPAATIQASGYGTTNGFGLCPRLCNVARMGNREDSKISHRVCEVSP